MQEKVAGSRFACLMRVSGTAASTGLHTARAACFHLRSRRPDFPWPCCPDALMPAHHGHLPSTPSCTLCCRVGNPIGIAKRATCGCSVTPTAEACPTQGLQCACEILPDHSCTILPLLYQLRFPGSSNTLWPGSLSLPMLPVEAIAP